MTSPCVFCTAHHRAAARAHVDLCADVAVAARAVVARRRCSPCCEPGAGPYRAPKGRASRAPRPHCDITLCALRCPSPSRRPRARRPSAPMPPLPPSPSWRVGAARLVAIPAPARASRRVSMPPARPRHPRDITLRALRCPSPRRSPRARRPSAPTPPLPPAPSRRVGAARPVASSALALAARRVSAPLVRHRHHRDHTARVLCCHPRAAAQAHFDLLRRRRRCRLRRRGASTLLALLRSRRRPVPRAE